MATIRSDKSEMSFLFISAEKNCEFFDKARLFCYDLVNQNVRTKEVEYIDKVTSKFGTSIEGYYLERSEEEDEWWHVWVIASRKTNLVTIRINRCPSPHPLTRKRYEQLSEVNNAPL